jgi:hypothetical protein
MCDNHAQRQLTPLEQEIRDRIEMRFPSLMGLPFAIAQTGEEYRELPTQGFGSANEARSIGASSQRLRMCVR